MGDGGDGKVPQVAMKPVVDKGTARRLPVLPNIAAVLSGLVRLEYYWHLQQKRGILGILKKLAKHLRECTTMLNHSRTRFRRRTLHSMGP